MPASADRLSLCPRTGFVDAPRGVDDARQFVSSEAVAATRFRLSLALYYFQVHTACDIIAEPVAASNALPELLLF